MTKNDRVIPKVNYFWLALIILVTCGLLYYFYLWYTEYSEDRLSKPLLNEIFFEIKYNEIDNYALENSVVVVYSSLVGDKKIRKFENELVQLADEFDIKQKLVYLNVSEFVDNRILVNELNKKYSIDNISFLDSVPSILLFNSGELVDIYFVKENNYSIVRLENYLKAMNVIDVYD